MKAAILAILALSALSVALAFTVTAYSDTACATLAANPVLGIPNPSIGNLNVCTKSFTTGGTTYYVKYTACTSTAATTSTYTDAACTTCMGPCSPITDVPGACLATGFPSSSGVGSYKVACASAATATLAFVLPVRLFAPPLVP